MKKMLFVATVLSLLVFVAYAYGAEAQPQVAAPIQTKEWISQEMPAEIKQVLESTPVGEVGKNAISSKGTNVLDYGLIYLVTSEEHLINFLLEGKADLYLLLSLTPSKDEKGVVVPDSYDGAVIAVVFPEKYMAWYKSAEAKKIFEMMTKATQ